MLFVAERALVLTELRTVDLSFCVYMLLPPGGLH